MVVCRKSRSLLCYQKGGISILSLKNDHSKSLYDYDVDKTYAVKLEKIKKGEKISILSDTMLKAMFQNHNRLKYSAKFLSYYLDIRYEELLENISLSTNELDKEKENTKGQRCDYVANIKDTSLNIEVNNNTSVDIMERNVEYAYKLFTRKIKRGSMMDYSQVIQFNLNNFSFKNHEVITDIYTIQNKDGIKLNNKLIFVQIYVPNLRKKWYNEGGESLTEEERYLLSLVETDIEKLEKIGDDAMMKEYIKEAEKASFEEEVGESYDKEWALKEEGRKEGVEQGSLYKAIEIAKSLLKNKVDIHIVASSTGLSMEAIQKLQK